MSILRRFRDAIISIVLLLIPFLVLNSNLKNPSHLNGFDRGILKLSAPIQYVATELADAVSGVLEHYVWLVNVSKENERLQRDNTLLRYQRQAWLRDAQENRRLREMLHFRGRSTFALQGAQVIAKDINEFFRVVRLHLDLGERDLVRPGMPVIVPGGLVGQIQRTSGAYSDVLLTVDRRSAVDIIIQRNGARGMLRGTGESNRYVCKIQYLDRANEVKVGDLVVTSGLGKRFPSAIPIGKVTRVIQKKFGLYQEAEVVPHVDFSVLEEVFVILSDPAQAEIATTPLP